MNIMNNKIPTTLYEYNRYNIIDSFDENNKSNFIDTSQLILKKFCNFMMFSILIRFVFQKLSDAALLIQSMCNVPC